MVYIQGSNVLENRSIWRISIISDAFWGIINFVILFFHTMVSPSLTKQGYQSSSSDYRPGGGPPKPPGRRVGRPGGGGNSPYNPGPPMGGGG